MSFCAGAFGVEEDERGVRPGLGWVVAPRFERRQFVAYRDWSVETPILRPIAPEALRTLDGLVRDATGLGPFGLHLSGCDELASLDGMTGCPLSSSHVFDCDRIASLDGLRGLSALRDLSIHLCRGLRDITALAALPNLRSLDLGGCPNISDLRTIAGLRGPEHLGLARLPSLPDPLAGRHEGADAISRVQAALG